VAAIATPWAIQANSHPASSVRQSKQGVFGSPVGAFAGGVGSTAGGGGHGVCGATQLVVSAGGGLSVNVSQGLVAIRGTESQHQGVYGPCYNDATLNLVLATADATNPRNDLIVAKIRDSQFSGASNDFSIVVVTGTPAASPSDPSVPANAVVLYRVRVNAGAGTPSVITDLRPRAYALGAPGTSTAALISTVPGQGQLWYVTDASLPSGAVAPQATGRPNAPGLYVFDVRWDPPWNLPWGIMGIAQAVANQGSITAEVDLTSLTITLTAVANRRLLLWVEGRSFFSTVANDILGIRLKEGGTQLMERYSTAIGASTGSNFPGTRVPITPTAAAHTYKATALRASGTGTLTVEAAATYPLTLFLEDKGPNGQPA
jgi:hypothetical protein